MIPETGVGRVGEDDEERQPVHGEDIINAVAIVGY